jgi:hypothetical protein
VTVIGNGFSCGNNVFIGIGKHEIGLSCLFSVMYSLYSLPFLCLYRDQVLTHIAA